MVETPKSMVEWFTRHVESLKGEGKDPIIRRNALSTTYKLAWRLKTLAEHPEKETAVEKIGRVMKNANPDLPAPELSREELEELSESMRHYIHRVEGGESPFKGQRLAPPEKSFARESAENEAREL